MGPFGQPPTFKFFGLDLLTPEFSQFFSTNFFREILPFLRSHFIINFVKNAQPNPKKQLKNKCNAIIRKTIKNKPTRKINQLFLIAVKFNKTAKIGMKIWQSMVA